MSTYLQVYIQTNPYRSTGVDFLRLEATTQELTKRNVGKLIESSKEAGYVQFTYQVEDVVVAKAKAVLVVAKRFPGHSYRVDMLKLKADKEQSTDQRQQFEVVSTYNYQPSLGMGL